MYYIPEINLDFASPRDDVTTGSPDDCPPGDPPVLKQAHPHPLQSGDGPANGWVKFL